MKKILLIISALLAWHTASAQEAYTIPNCAATGTTLNTLTKRINVSSSSCAVIVATTDTAGVIGITTKGNGTSGLAEISRGGIITCLFDNATTAEDYVQISAVTAGNCRDVGATRPTVGQIIGRVIGTGGGAGTYTVAWDRDIYPTSSGGTTWPIMLGSGSAVTNSATEFIGLGTFNATESLGPTEVPRAGTISTMYCHTSTALSGAMTWALTVRTGTAANAPTMADTALTCTLNSTNTQTCSDLTHSFSLAAGDFVDVKTVPTSSPTTGTIHCSMLMQ